MLQFEDFHAFFQCKSFDVLSSGNYKKHLTQCKENGDLWAIELHSKQNKIQYIIKQIHAKINSISSSKLGIACKTVTNCAQPPIRIYMGFSKCFLTDLFFDQCLDLSKTGKKNHELHVHPKFAYFFLFMWFICKLEYIIRACCKYWNDNKQYMSKKKEIDSDINREYLEENNEFCKELFHVFERAFEYVSTSLDLYQTEFAVKPILEPPSGFFKQ